MRWLAGLFLVAHGLVHVAIWLAPTTDDAPFDPHHSPLAGDVRPLSTVAAVAAGVAFAAAGVAYLADQSWWAVPTLAAAVVSLLLLFVTFTPWWLLAVAINVTIAVLAWRSTGGT